MKLVDAVRLYRELFDAKARRETKLSALNVHMPSDEDQLKMAILDSEIGLLIIILAAIEGAEVEVPNG